MKLPDPRKVAVYVTALIWGLLGFYGAFHLVADSSRTAELVELRAQVEVLVSVDAAMESVDAQVDYLVCYREQRELARDSLPATAECIPPST